MLTCSRNFPQWLAGNNCAIAFSTYQAGKLLLLGVGPDEKLMVFERSFARAMGIAVTPDGNTLALAGQHDIRRFDNVVKVKRSGSEYDAIYAPHAAWVTGDVDAHDIGFGSDGRPIFVNTLFSCLATVSDGHNFKPIWRPPFISRLAPEDRCHLNGMALDDGLPRYVTAVSRSDVADGWRDARTDGGIVMDVASSRIIAEGLSMPHSPRLHRDKLWLLNSGAGEFGFVDLQSGRFEPLSFCPGYARGLAFIGNHAIIGLSLPRGERTFEGLPLEEALRGRSTQARCGLAIFDLERGDMVQWVRIEGVVQELYDVAILPDVQRPSLIGFKSDEVRFVISIDE